MIEPKKRKGPGPNEMALVPALKKPRSEMAAAPGQQQLMPMVSLAFEQTVTRFIVLRFTSF